MDMQQALTARAVEHEALGPLLAVVDDTRAAHWVEVPAGVGFPRLVMRCISNPRHETRKGLDASQFTRVQCDCEALTYGAAKAVSDGVLEALVPAGVFHGIYFQRASVNGPRDLGERTADGFIHRQSLDLIIRHAPA